MISSLYKKISFVLTEKQRKGLIFIFLLILIGVFVEILGIGMIIPVMNVIVEDDIIKSYPSLNYLWDFLGYPRKKILIIYSLIFLLIIYGIKNIFLAYLTWKKSNFTFNLYADISKRLLNIYLNQNYSFHLNKNSSELVQNVLIETRHFGKGFILSIIDLSVEILVLFFLLMLLIFVEPIGAIISLFLFSILGISYYFITKRKLTTYGIERQKYEGIKIKYLNEIFDNIKIINLLGKEQKFLSDYNYGNTITANIGRKTNFIQQMPRLFFEYVSVLLFCALVLIFLYFKNNEFSNFITTVGVFVAATFRILPSFNKILIKSQTLRFSKSAIDLVYREFVNAKKITINNEISKNINFEKLNINNLSFSYNEPKKTLLKDVSLQIDKGKTYGFIGPSGSGKSTLLDLIMNIQLPLKGEIKINNDIDVNNVTRSWQKILGYVPQNVVLTDDTLANNIAFGQNENEIDYNKINSSIKSAQLGSYINTLEKGLETLVGENGTRISGGERQRVGIARALYLNPQILVLDEITSSLDLLTEKNLIEDLNKLKGNKTILIITHRLSSLKYCDEIFEFENNKVKKLNNEII